MMNLNGTLKKLRNELTKEYKTTASFLQLFPEEKIEYTPHEKA